MKLKTYLELRVHEVPVHAHLVGMDGPAHVAVDPVLDAVDGVRVRVGVLARILAVLYM